MSIGRPYADSNTKSILDREEDENFADTVDLLQQQITLEYKLQATCQDLLYHYKESHNWVAVSQIAQNLITNSQRIDDLKKELLTVRAGCVLSPGLDSIKESEDTESEGGKIFPESIEVEAEHFDLDLESGVETGEEEKPVKLEHPVSINEADMSELETPLTQNHINEVTAKVETAQHSNPPSPEIEESIRTTEESCRSLETNYKPDCSAAESPHESNCFTSGENTQQSCGADKNPQESSPAESFQQEGSQIPQTPGEDSQASLAPAENSSVEVDSKPTHSGSTPPETEDCEGTAESCKHLESSPEGVFCTSAEFTDVISDQTSPVAKHPHPPSDTMSEVDTTTLSHSGIEATMRENGLSNLALTVRVSRVLDADSGEVSYLVDTYNLDPLATEPKQSMSHSLKEFCELREQLATKRELPELDVSNCESCKVDGMHNEDVCKKLEKFLNTVVCDSVLREEPIVVRFLIETNTAPEKAHADKDERKQESVPSQSEPTPLNGRDLHSSEVKPGNIPSTGDSSQGLGHQGLESDPELDPVSRTSEQGQDEEEEGEMQGSEIDPASCTSELRKGEEEGEGEGEGEGDSKMQESEIDPAHHTNERGQGDKEGKEEGEEEGESRGSEIDPTFHTSEPGQEEKNETHTSGTNGQEEAEGVHVSDGERSEIDPASRTSEPAQEEKDKSEIDPTSLTSGQEDKKEGETQESDIDPVSRTSEPAQEEKDKSEIDPTSLTSGQEDKKEGETQESDIDPASRTSEPAQEEKDKSEIDPTSLTSGQEDKKEGETQESDIDPVSRTSEPAQEEKDKSEIDPTSLTSGQEDKKEGETQESDIDPVSRTSEPAQEEKDKSEIDPTSLTSGQEDKKEGETQESDIDPASRTSEPVQEEKDKSEIDPTSLTSGQEDKKEGETQESDIDPTSRTSEPAQEEKDKSEIDPTFLTSGQEDKKEGETQESDIDPTSRTSEPAQEEKDESEIDPTSRTSEPAQEEKDKSEIDPTSLTSGQEDKKEGETQESDIDPTSRTKELGKEEEGREDNNASQANQGEEEEDKSQGSAETEHLESADTRGLVDSTSSDTAVTLSSSGGKTRLSRSESNPLVGGVTTVHDDSVLHLNLTPLSPTAPKAASSENIVDDDDFFSDKNSLKKRQRSVPSIFKRASRSGSVIRQLSQRMKTKWRTTNYDRDSSIVEVPKNIPTQEWDPTCLLEELYSDHKPGAAQCNPSGESARYFGYMEKLPINQSKSTVMKGWKRRYFRAMEGNIFYYEERTSEKPLGCTRLSNSKIICNTKKCQIQVTEKNGRFLMIKAPDVAELNAWHRALQLEAAHPTMVSSPNFSPHPQRDNPVVIIDIGACSVRAGFAGENAYPELFFPAVCSIDASTNDPIDCGLNAFLPQNRYGAHLIYPRKQSLRMDHHDSSVKITAVHAIIESVLLQLNVQARDCHLLLVLPSTVPEQERIKLIELLLETFAFSGIYLQEQAILALYSYNTTSGVVVDMGDHIDIIPVIDGYIVEAGITRLPFGGNAITENISKLITTKGVRYFSETEMFINRFIKESLCFVSQNYAEDCTKCDASPAEYTRAVDVDRFQLPDHRKVVALDSSLFQAPEGLFSPILWGKDVPGVQEAVWKALQTCPIDQRKELSRKIFLSGGTSLLPGIQERLKQELISLSPQGTTVEVHASETRQHAAYRGASVLSSLSSFQSMLLTHEEWSTLGIDALKKWSIS